MAYLGGGDIGCSSTRIEEGSTASPAARSARDRSRALHSALLGPCCSEKQFPELLPSTEAMRHQAHGPRLERGDAPARGTRRGSTEGMAPWRHLTAGVKPGRARPGRGRSPLSHQTGRTRKGWRHPKRENEVARSPVSSRRVQIRPGDTGCASSEWARSATVVLARNRQEILPRGKPCVEANADRGGSLARRRIHGSRACPRVEHALQRSVVQSQPREARLKVPQPDFGPRVGALHRPRVNHASGSRRVGGGSGRG